MQNTPLAKTNEILGMDTDEVLGYTTSKVVWIRDRWVGACYYSLVLMVLIYIIGIQVLCRNEHFELKDVRGLTRLWYSYPTLSNCDPLKEGCRSDYKSLTELPYCDQYTGPLDTGERGHCAYESKLSMVPGGVVDNRLFIPTAVEILTEMQDCTPSASNNYQCGNEYIIANGSDCLHGNYQCSTRGGKKNQFFYVADVKNYKIRFTSSFDRDGIRGNSLMLPAYVGVCDATIRKGNKIKTWSERKFSTKNAKCKDSELKLEKIPCEFGVDCAEMHKFDILEDSGIGVAGKEFTHRIDRIREELVRRGKNLSDPDAMLTEIRSKRHRGLRRGREVSKRWAGRASISAGGGHKEDPAAEWYGAKKEYSDNWGDVFTIGRLLQLAGADLDLDRNMDGWTTRQAGTALEVIAVYNNLYPILSTFGYTPVQYHYQVNELILPYVSRAQVSRAQPHDYPKSRISEVQYGVMIHFKVGGSFGFFSIVYLILMLTAAFALTATATTITDGFFLYVSGQRDNFFHLKYEVSPDFSELWECQTCNFMNLPEHDECRGVPKFSCPRTTPACGAARSKEVEGGGKPEEAEASASS